MLAKVLWLMRNEGKPLFAALSLSWWDNYGGLHGEGERRIITCRHSSYLTVLSVSYCFLRVFEPDLQSFLSLNTISFFISSLVS